MAARRKRKSTLSKAAARRSTGDLTAALSLFNRLLAPASIEGIAQSVLDGLRPLIRADHVLLFLHEEERLILRSSASAAAAGGFAAADARAAESLGRRALEQQSPLFLRSLLRQKEVDRSAVARSAFSSVCALPLSEGSADMGVLVIASITRRDFAAHSRLLQTIAATIAVIVKHALATTSAMKTTEALRQSEELFRVLAEHATDAIIVQTDYKFAYVNKEAMRIFGATSPDQLLGMPILDRIHPDFREFILKRIRLTNSEKRNSPLSQIVYLRLDGSSASVESIAAPVTYDGRDGSVTIAFDIEGRKRHARAVRESEERLRRAQVIAHTGNWELDLQTRVMRGSEEAFRIYGLDPKAGHHNLAFVQGAVLEKYRPDLDRAMRALIDNGTPYELEFEIQRHNDGMIRYIYSKAELVRDNEGKPLRVVGVIQDITERKNVQLALQESEELYRRLVTTIPDVIIRTDMDGNILFINESGMQTLGYETNERVLGKNILSFVAEKDRARAEENSARMFERYLGPIEYSLRGDDGAYRDCEVKGDVLRTTDGKAFGLVYVVRDITERKRNDQALRESEYFLRKSQEAARIGSYYLATRTGHWVSSPVLDDIFGIPRTYTKDIEGWLRLIHPDQRDEMNEYFTGEILTRHNHFDKTYRIIRQADRQERWVRGQGELEFDAEGNVTAMIGTIQDVTDRTHYEMTIIAALNEKEILLKEIHHRVKNNMQVISSLLSLQGAKIDDPVMKALLFESMNRIRSMALVHERLYQAKNLASIDFREYLNGMATELSRAYARNDVAIRIDAESMQMGIDLAIPCGLIANELISNAFKHAFPHERPGTIEVRLHRIPNNLVRLCVADDGVGITNVEGTAKGETLGMTIITALVDQIAGHLVMAGKAGTEATVEFPLAET